MDSVSIYTDGSVNNQLKLGYGAYLLVGEEEHNADLQSSVQTKQFSNTSSTKLEIQTINWVLKEVCTLHKKIIMYTDSQNIISLIARRGRLEANNYITNSGTEVRNKALYQEFFKLIDNLTINILKIKGHKKSSEKDDNDKLFTYVDRASRRALKTFIKENNL